MAKNDLYHKVDIGEVLQELERTQRQTPWTFGNEDASEHPGNVKLNREARLEEIAAFEEKVGQELPSDYVAFLQKSNGAYVFGIEIYGLGDVEHKPFTQETDSGAVRSNNEVYAIAHWYTGDDILINLRAPSGAKSQNRRDVIDRFHETDECQVIAKSFGEFLYRIVRGSNVHEGGDDRSGGIDVSPDETLNGALYWLQEEFRPYRELYGVEFAD